MLRSLALAFALFTTACATISTPGDAVVQFVDAFNHLDAGALRPLLADDATAFLPMPQNAELVQGREKILGILTPLLEADRQRRNGQPLSLEAKNLSLQQRGGFAIATFDVGTADVHSRRTLVLERRGGRWVIVHLHASNVRPDR